MREGQTRYLLGGSFRTLTHTEWGDRDAPPVVCVHGLTRSGRDFDALAQHLARDFWVLCPDLPGRGRSDWLEDSALYQPIHYVTALAALLAVIGRRVGWVGTSLGGICGMLVASMPGQPITRMVLNDIGPHIPAGALARIRDYIGATPVFADVAALEQHLRRVHAPFGRLSDAQWAHLATTSARAVPGGVALHYDPAIAEQVLATPPGDVDLWPVWARISIPMLAIRGVDSDLLLPETLAQMATSGAQTLMVPNAGHAPALMDAPTMAAVAAFLEPNLRKVGRLGL